jgi:inner membrane protein
MSLLPAGERRSLGLKFLLVVALAALMTIPTLLIWGIISERTTRAQAVVAEVGARFGGPQTFTGPILAAPFTQALPTPPTPENPRPNPTVNRGWYVVFAKTGAADATAETSVRARGSGELFKVRVYTADVAFKAAFDLPQSPTAVPENATIDWGRAVLLIGVGDARGAAAPAALTINGGAGGPRTLPLEPGSAYANIIASPAGGFPGAFDSRYGGPVPVAGGGGQWLVAQVGDFARPGAVFEVASALKFNGVERLGLTPFARDTDLTMTGNWPHVGYFGAFPADAAPDPQSGFSAKWSVPFIARNLAEAGDAATLSGFAGLAVETAFVDPANPYNWVNRALVYSPLFVGIVFLLYFLFEATSPRRAHPAQYVLVGLAQAIFYLLLLSLAERLGFDWAFLIAAAVTVAQIGWYAGAVFQSRQRGLIATAIFAVLYGLIYLLLKLDDFALLVGSVSASLVVLAVMIATRNLDWYGLSQQKPDAPAVPPDWKPNP